MTGILIQIKEIYQHKSDHLRQFLEKEDNDQKMKKKKKYNCDFADYSNKVVFKWQIKVDEPMESGEYTIPPTALPQPSSTPFPTFAMPYSSHSKGNDMNSRKGYNFGDNHRGSITSKPKPTINKLNGTKPRQSGAFQPANQNHPVCRDATRGGYPPQRTPYRENYNQQGQWEHRGDPRDSVNQYGQSSNRQPPRGNQVPLRNRFAPLSYHQDEYLEGGACHYHASESI